MKKKWIILMIGLMAFGQAYAQEYRVNKSTGRLVIRLSAVTIEGYDGSEVIFTSPDKKNTDEHAAGLQLLSGSGMVDNTRLGIHVTDKGNDLEVTKVASDLGPISIKVPRNMSISYTWQNVINTDKVIIKDVRKEIDISAANNNVELENVSGPLSVNTIHGAVMARFREKVTGPITLVSVYANVDVILPLSTKASLKLNTTYGSIFAAPELNIALMERPEHDTLEGKGNVVGTLNGGGTAFNLTSTYGKVYLRKP